MGTGYKRIKILSEAEISDLYSLPQFTLKASCGRRSENYKQT